MAAQGRGFVNVFPTRLVVDVVLALCLFARESYEEVLQVRRT
ncbi:hypothetical protein ACGFYE_38185 [Streptomyces zaomyceticus]